MKDGFAEGFEVGLVAGYVAAIIKAPKSTVIDKKKQKLEAGKKVVKSGQLRRVGSSAKYCKAKL